jgi:nicotinamidase-related amidase
MPSTTTPPPVLLVVDLQQALVEGFPGSDEGRSTPDLTSNVSKLLSHWRRRAWPVIHIHHDDPNPEEALNMANHPDNCRAHACSAPQPEEPVLVKHVGSAFTDAGRQLETRLRWLSAAAGGGGGHVVVIGMDGAQCINDSKYYHFTSRKAAPAALKHEFPILSV